MHAPICTNVTMAVVPPSSASPPSHAFLDNWFFPPRSPCGSRPNLKDKNGRVIKKNQQPKETKNETHQGCGAPIDKKLLSQPLLSSSSSLSRACKGIVPLPQKKEPASILLKGQERPVSLLRSVKETPATKPPVVKREQSAQERAPVSCRAVKDTPVIKPPVVVLQREQGAQENAPAASRAYQTRSVTKGVTEPPPVVVLQHEQGAQENAPAASRTYHTRSVTRGVVKPPVVMRPRLHNRRYRRANQKAAATAAAANPVVVLQREDRVQEKAPVSRRSVKETPVVEPLVVLQRGPDYVEKKAPASRDSVTKAPVVKPLAVIQGERQTQEKAPTSRRSVKETPVVKPQVVVLQGERVREYSPIPRRSVEKPPVVEPVVLLQRGHHDKVSATKTVKTPPRFFSKSKRTETRDDMVSAAKTVKTPPGFFSKSKRTETRDDRVSAAKTVKTPPGFFSKSKRTETRDDRVWAAWKHHHHALFTSLNKVANDTNTIPSVVFTNQYIVPDDAVSVLYDDADVDDEDALPPATIAVLENFFDGLDSDMEETDDESSCSSSADASYQNDLYSKMLATPPAL